VDQQRQHSSVVAVIELRLFRPHPPQNNRINSFEMRRVGRQGEMHFIVIKNTVRRCAKMIFDIT
jgi:hypothetical protein